ncbi:MAG TPA: hypothetical protein VMH30_10690 [Verrucomicrobiae bacterium]|nr:hypothetical protein [Verrucomicrobiae bacterium]
MSKREVHPHGRILRKTIQRPAGQPARYLTVEFHQEEREEHTQGKFVPAAMNLSLAAKDRRKRRAPEAPHRAAGRIRLRAPGTLQTDNSNIRRKPAARGRAKDFTS